MASSLLDRPHPLEKRRAFSCSPQLRWCWAAFASSYRTCLSSPGSFQNAVVGLSIPPLEQLVGWALEIRVGRETRHCHWEQGRCFVLDDSFEHEVQYARTIRAVPYSSDATAFEARAPGPRTILKVDVERPEECVLVEEVLARLSA